MDSMHLTREEKEEAIRWAEDSSWVEREDYYEDTDYMECVRDIIESPVFQSMDNYMQHGDTTCKAHCIKVSYMGYCICRKMGWNMQKSQEPVCCMICFCMIGTLMQRKLGNISMVSLIPRLH